MQSIAKFSAISSHVIGVPGGGARFSGAGSADDSWSAMRLLTTEAGARGVRLAHARRRRRSRTWLGHGTCSQVVASRDGDQQRARSRARLVQARTEGDREVAQAFRRAFEATQGAAVSLGDVDAGVLRESR